MNINEIYEQLPEQYQKNIVNGDLILTGSWQYGTNTDESDLDLVLLHDFNHVKETIDVEGVCHIPFDEKQFSHDIYLYGAERQCDIRVMSYTNFARKLYSGDINCVEYISSPYYKRPSKFLDEVFNIFHKYSLQAPFFKYKVLKSLLGFLNPMNKKKSKKFIVPERVNPNNLIKIANLFYLIKFERYPLNPDMAMSLMIHPNTGENVDMIDATSPNHMNTEIMTAVLEKYKGELETQWSEDIESKRLYGNRQYMFALKDVYFPRG